jgi:uncharacterized protein YnzC (UPF0291/DUF896 family)
MQSTTDRETQPVEAAVLRKEYLELYRSPVTGQPSGM